MLSKEQASPVTVVMVEVLYVLYEIFTYLTVKENDCGNIRLCVSICIIYFICKIGKVYYTCMTIKNSVWQILLISVSKMVGKCEFKMETCGRKLSSHRELKASK